MQKTYFIKTFGCQMNYADSERIASFLENYKLTPAKNIQKADLAIFNTCGIRQTAENRAYSTIHTLRKNRPDIKIILTGCLAHRQDVQKRLQNKVNLFTEIQDFTENVSGVLYSIFDINQDSKIQNTKYKILNTKNDFGKEKIAYLSIKPKHKNSYQAYIPIMTGCNNFCSYCVVPYARGREISRPAGEIIREVKNLIKKGCKEIVLLGQNVNSYKSEIQKSEFKINSKFINFSNLLREINLIPGNFWISFASSHPKDFSNELIETIAQCKKVCEWVHLPIQAGNDKILEKMNRRYSQTYYLNLLKKMRAAFKKYKPDILYSLSSDIIVGFPGETKKQFLDSAKVMEKAKFDMVYFGQYSPRPGTLAYKLKDSVSKKEKSRREKYLNEILKKTSSENNQKYLGRTLEVLIDKKELPKAKPLDPKGLALGENTYFGRTRTMKNVKIISTKKNLVGKIVKVEIIQTNIWNLEGKL